MVILKFCSTFLQAQLNGSRIFPGWRSQLYHAYCSRIIARSYHSWMPFYYKKYELTNDNNWFDIFTPSKSLLKITSTVNFGTSECCILKHAQVKRRFVETRSRFTNTATILNSSNQSFLMTFSIFMRLNSIRYRLRFSAATLVV